MSFVPHTSVVRTSGAPMERYSNRRRRRFELAVQAGQGQAKPYRQFEVGGIVDGKVVGTSKMHGIGPGPRRGFVIDNDRQAAQQREKPRAAGSVKTLAA